MFDIVQTDARSVRVRTDNACFLLPYRFFWNGQERIPESVALEGGEVSAFFLAATIKDVIRMDARGILIRRTWSVKTPGQVRLSIPMEFEDADGFSYLFPAVEGESHPPLQRRAFLQERSAYPCGLFLYHGESGILVYAGEPSSKAASAADGSPAAAADAASTTVPTDGSDAGVTAAPGAAPAAETPSIAIETVAVEDEPALLRVEITLPGREEPFSRTGPAPSHTAVRRETTVESTGTLERSFLLRVVSAPRRQIHGRGFLSVSAPLARTGKHAPQTRSLDDLRQALRECAVTHLHRGRGVFGLREVPGSRTLSAEAGVRFASLLLVLFPKDGVLTDIALSLADFCLKGQHPTGLFFEGYDLESCAWQGVRGRRGKPLLSIARASAIAEAFLSLASEMEARGLDGGRYAAAGERFVDFFFPGKGAFLPPGSLHMAGERTPEESGLERFAFFPPLWSVFQAGKKDRHRKAVNAMVREFSLLERATGGLAASRPGRDPDSSAALLEARIFLSMRAAGFKLPGADELVSRLVPWVNVNRSGMRDGDGDPVIDPLGGLLDSFRRQRLLFAGHETAWLLLSLRPLLKEPWLAGVAAELAAASLRFSAQARIGTSWYQHTLWDSRGRVEDGKGLLGPVDSRRLASEGTYLLRLHEGKPRPRR